MTAIRYVTEGQMARKTGMTALGYAFPDDDEIWLQKGLPKDVELEVRKHEFDHIKKGEEGPFWGALIGAGASILGGALSSSGSSKAADAQSGASKYAVDFQRESRDLALTYQKPYRDASYAATAALMDLAGLSRKGHTIDLARNAAADAYELSPELESLSNVTGGGVYGKLLRRAMDKRVADARSGKIDPAAYDDIPNIEDYPTYDFKQDPGYQFRLDEGMRTLERGAAARGGLLSGGFARKALRYAQDYASNEYANVYNRIASIAGFGQAATNNSTNAILTTGANAGNAMINAGEARASGYVAQGNAWANAINQIGQIDWESAFAKGG